MTVVFLCFFPGNLRNLFETNLPNLLVSFSILKVRGGAELVYPPPQHSRRVFISEYAKDRKFG